MSAKGVTDLPSPYPVKEAIDRLEILLESKGIKIFDRIDQQAEAAQVGLEMRATELLIFGDPKAGTPLMNAHPSVALDLPSKALAWEAADGQVWLSYNSPEYLAERHQLEKVPLKPFDALIKEALR
jgi:uncharacterized protein (DUF302 family)